MPFGGMFYVYVCGPIGRSMYEKVGIVQRRASVGACDSCLDLHAGTAHEVVDRSDPGAMTAGMRASAVVYMGLF